MAKTPGRLLAASMTTGVALLGLAAPAVPVVVGAGGCTGSDCGGDSQSWGSCTQGERLDDDTWESGPVTGQPYLDFPGQRTWVLDPGPWMGSRQPIGFEAYLSLSSQPNTDAGGGFALPAGNLAELQVVPNGDGWRVHVLNDTCAHYYLRVVLRYAASDAGATSRGDCSSGSEGGAG